MYLIRKAGSLHT